MPVHLELATLQIATATETNLAAAAPDSLNVKIGDEWKDPRLVACRAVSANTQYGRIRHMRNATGVYFPGTVVAGTLTNGGYHVLGLPQKLMPGELLQIRALQDSGGNEESNVAYAIAYNQKSGTGTVVKDVQSIRAASTVNTVADAWTRTCININNLYAGFELEQGEKYAILRSQAIGANLEAARLRSSAFGGVCWPVGTATDVGQSEMLDYMKAFGERPVFTHPSTLDLECFDDAAEATLLYLELGKI